MSARIGAIVLIREGKYARKTAELLYPTPLGWYARLNDGVRIFLSNHQFLVSS